MRSWLVVCVGLAGCVDFNRGPSLSDLVGQFEDDQGLEEVVECPPVSVADCETDAEFEAAFAEGVTCLADAFAECTPARLQVITANGDGVKTYETFVVHPVGDTCAVERFADIPEGGRRVLVEQSCDAVSASVEEACVPPEASECSDVCGGDAEECWW